MPAAAFAVGFAVVIVRDASEVTERTCHLFRIAVQALVAKCLQSSHSTLLCLQFRLGIGLSLLAPWVVDGAEISQGRAKIICDGTGEASVPNRLVGTPFSHPRIGCQLSDDASATPLCGRSRACRPPDRRPTPSYD